MPHIYHSALLLSPQTSTVHKLYQLYATPLVRLVQGVPIVWEPFAASRSHSDFIGAVAWSPCNKFIAIAWTNSNTTGVFDAITLKQLNTFKSPRDNFCHLWLGFSPDSHFLAEVDRTNIISWDLQTGGGVGAFDTGLWLTSNLKSSAVYSTDGKMIAVVFWEWNEPFPSVRIYVYNILSQEHICSHRLQGRVVSIWTQGEYLQVATVKPGSVTVWEVGFSSDHIPAEIKSYTIPNKTESAGKILFLPALTRLAFTLKKEVLIWDAQGSKILLNIVGKGVEIISFSPDGHFFACGGPETHLWKESSAGYILHGTFASSARDHGYLYAPLLSPNGQSIIVSSGSTLQLWHTTAASPPTHAFEGTGRHVFEFSSDKSLAASARLSDNIATVLDPKSGAPRLIIDTGIKIYGLRITGSTVIVVGDGKVITWDLSTGDGVLGARANINDSVRTTTFDHSPCMLFTPSASISPDLKYIAVAAEPMGQAVGLNIYDVSTGKHLTGTGTSGRTPWFTPDGCEIWCSDRFDKWEGWGIIKDSESGVLELKSTQRQPEECPWLPSSRWVVDDGWILGSGGKRLLLLPPHWRTDGVRWTWGGRFLVLMHPGLPEVVILELPEE